MYVSIGNYAHIYSHTYASKYMDFEVISIDLLAPEDLSKSLDNQF